MSSSITSMSTFLFTCWSFLELNDNVLLHYALEEERTCDLAPRCHLSLEAFLLSFAICICLFNMNRIQMPCPRIVFHLGRILFAVPASGMKMESVPLARYVNLPL